VVEGEHDGADHGHQQNEPRRLEQIDVARVEQLTQGLGVAHLGSRRRRRIPDEVRRGQPGADHEDQLHKKQNPDDGADRQIFEKARAQLGEIHVEHHNHEQEQHHDRADIDDHQDHGEELGAQQHEQTGGVEEGKDEIEHRMHRVLRGDHHHAGADAHRGEQIEEQRGEHHAAFFVLTSRSKQSPARRPGTLK